MTRRATVVPAQVAQVVREIMITPPVTVTPRTTISALAKLFDHNPDIDAFPVVTDTGVLLGIVSRLDILRVLRPDEELRTPDPRRVAETPVSAVMRHGVISVESEDPAFAAADLMVETRFHSLPVVRRARGQPVLIGMVTRRALLHALLPAELR